MTEKGEDFPDVRVSEKYPYRRVKFRQGSGDGKESLWHLGLPKSLTTQAITLAHDACCHGGYLKTLYRDRQKYDWPTMARDVKSYVAQCEFCKSIKLPNQILRPSMGDSFNTVRPLHRIYCDFVGPYPFHQVLILTCVEVGYLN